MGVFSRENKCLTFSLGKGWFRLRFNPVVTLLSVIIIWGFVIWCMVLPSEAFEELQTWKKWVNETWTWLYIGTQDVWALFILVIFFSKYSKMKLGADDEEPEFSDVTYFTMLFAAGIGIGLFFFGVAEPIGHYAKYQNRYWKRHSDNLQAQDAINVVFYHWGIHGWVVYVLVGLLLGFIAYRQRLPMTMRTCFYPILGDRVFGFLGDLVDTLSVVATMFGVCTSLGIGTIQFNQGLNRVNSNIEKNRTNQIIIIWGITAVATVSVITGMKVGIRRLSEICFTVGMVLLAVVFFYDDTWYLLNVFTQSLGYYLQWIIQIGFHTDAFAHMNTTKDWNEEYRDPKWDKLDDRTGKPAYQETPNWMHGWTVFYWGWWIAWSPFVGMFIAKISKGRTVGEFITYTLTVPVVYVFFWFSVFGGAAIKMERAAFHAGIQCNDTFGGAKSTLPFNGLWRLSCRDDYDMWFDIIQSYKGLATFLSVLSLIGILLYFITSSDSGSLIIDCLSANGDPEPPVLQRIFWALTEGATATALLYSGGQESLKALQTVSICSGLFYTIVLNFMCVALWRAMKLASGDIRPDQPEFVHDMVDPLYHPPKPTQAARYAIAIVAPWWPLSKVSTYEDPRPIWINCLVLGLPFVGWIILMACSPLNKGLIYLGWTLFCGFVSYATGIRAGMREKYGIYGNLAEDFFAFLLAYPLATIQLEDHVDSLRALEGRVKGGNPQRTGIATVMPQKGDHLEMNSRDVESGNGKGHSPTSRHVPMQMSVPYDGKEPVYSFNNPRLPALGRGGFDQGRNGGYDNPSALSGSNPDRLGPIDYSGRNYHNERGPDRWRHSADADYDRNGGAYYGRGRNIYPMQDDKYPPNRRSLDAVYPTTIDLR